LCYGCSPLMKTFICALNWIRPESLNSEWAQGQSS
jgi:hypothetical protein